MTPLALLTLAPGAFLAGVLMFLAPCTLPIVPGYLAFISGARRSVMSNALAFVVGFSCVFVLLGVSVGFIGHLLLPWQGIIIKVAGVLIIMFGLMMLGLLRLPWVGQEWHAKIPSFLRIGAWQSSLLIGALFAVGWSPCIGPILGTVLLIASISSTALQGAALLLIFSLGLSLPFLLTALLLERATSAFVRWERSIEILSWVGGAVLVVLGVLMILGEMGEMVAWAFSTLQFLGYDRLLNYL